MRLLTTVLLIAGLLSPQGPDPLAEKIRRDVEKIGIGGEITVIFKDDSENYGTITAIEQDKFSIAEVDLKKPIDVGFDELKKVRKNFGGKGFMGKRPDPKWGWIAGAVLFGALFALVIAIGGGS
jgi:hypothetical protein